MVERGYLVNRGFIISSSFSPNFSDITNAFVGAGKDILEGFFGMFHFSSEVFPSKDNRGDIYYIIDLIKYLDKNPQERHAREILRQEIERYNSSH